ncbi:MAG: hypothetical protein ABI877_19645 [Gemmatimonadaceae bacterium]
MLSYTFWHWKRPEVAEAEYEERQRAFHRALSAAPPPAFGGSSCFVISGAPWANDGGEAYEDWYLVSDSAALDTLNVAAISASRQVPHDAAAAVAAGGTAGLYRIRVGTRPSAPAMAHWFSKPSGMSYLALEQLLRPMVDLRQGALWCRQMTLGPTPEFCLQLPDPAAWDSGQLRARSVDLRRVA